MGHRHKFATYLAPAKLNLGLKITGKRDDGYHFLKTVFCLIDLFDEVGIQITDNGKISLIEHNHAWPFYDDLAYRAAALLQKFSPNDLGANIKIKKTIPSGAGMGGGSSDAATVLVVLNQLWDIQLPKHKLMDIGLSLGADIPFFIYGTNAIATGIGEVLEPVEIEKQYFVVVKPSFHITTQNVFSNLKLDFINMSAAVLSPTALIRDKENDLLSIAVKLYPQLQTIRKDLQQYGKVAMTGTGSALYLAYFDKNIAKKVANTLENRYNTYLVKRLSKSPLY